MPASQGEPAWLQRLRPAAKQRPRTQFIEIRWHDLQQLLQQRDLLLHHASEATRAEIERLAEQDYGRP